MGVPAWRGQLLQGTPPPAPPPPWRHQHRGWGPCSPQGTAFFVVLERPRDWGREMAPSPDGVCSAFSPAALELGAWQGWGQGLAGLHGHPGAMPAAPRWSKRSRQGQEPLRSVVCWGQVRGCLWNTKTVRIHRAACKGNNIFSLSLPQKDYHGFRTAFWIAFTFANLVRACQSHLSQC